MKEIFIISLIVFAIWYCFLEGEIFGKVGAWLSRTLPDWAHSPVYECPVCMTFYYGTAIYWLAFGYGVKDWLLTVIPAMGLNVVITRLWPKDEISLTDKTTEHKDISKPDKTDEEWRVQTIYKNRVPRIYEY